MIRIVPEDLIDRVLREQPCVVGDGTGPVEVKDLQPRRSANCKQLAGRRHPEIRDRCNQCLRHVRRSARSRQAAVTTLRINSQLWRAYNGEKFHWRHRYS